MQRKNQASLVLKKVEKALHRAAKGFEIPDYSAFQAFVGEHLEREIGESEGKVHADLPPYGSALMLLLARYHERFRSGTPSRMDFRRYKLLRSLFPKGSRSLQVIEAITGEGLPDDLTLDIDNELPASLRVRLFSALHNENYLDASYLLGQFKEADHDLGEREYFHALVSYKSGKLRRSIQLAEKVTAANRQVPNSLAGNESCGIARRC